MANDNVNDLLSVVRASPGKTRPELQKMTGMRYRSSLKTAADDLTDSGFAEERNGRYWPTPKKGKFVPRNHMTAERAAAAGQELEPSQRAKLIAAEQLRQAISDGQLLADGKLLAAAQALAAGSPPAPAVTQIQSKPSLFEGSPAEHLGANVGKSLQIQDAILSQAVQVDPETGELRNLRQAKLQAEVAATTLSIATKVDENSLRATDLQLKNLDRMIDRMLDEYGVGNDEGAGDIVDVTPAAPQHQEDHPQVRDEESDKRFESPKPEVSKRTYVLPEKGQGNNAGNL